MRQFSLLFLFVGLLVAIQGWAAPVDQAMAQRKAKSYLTNELYAGKMMAPAALNPVLLKAEPRNERQSQPVYYIYNTSTTFLVIAGDDRAEEILMVGDRPLKDINNLAPGMQDMLNIYKTEINFLFDNPDLKVDTRFQPVPSLDAKTYGPLLAALWGQGDPYNRQCTFTVNGTSYLCPTGCPATAAAMVLYYYKYPSSVGAQASYNSWFFLTDYYGISYTYSNLSATRFSWSNMRDTYTKYTTAQANAVATLMRYAGHAEHTMYGLTGSGIDATASADIATMFKNFGYYSTTRLVYKSSYSKEDDWSNLIISELANRRPVVYVAEDINDESISHAFDVDGYRASEARFHLNFGWDGDGNGWAVMNSFTLSGYTYSRNQRAIIGIQPPPTLNVSSTSLSFSGVTGQTYSQTFTVTGKYLTGNLTISKSGDAVYSVRPTSLTKVKAEAGATVKVTYMPTAAGTQTGNITISGGGASPKTVSLTGTAVAPTITVDPTSLTFSSITVGTSATKTFKVTGTNLTNNITLKVSGTGYYINKTTITPTEAKNGVLVTVTYQPTAAGTHRGKVQISSGDVVGLPVNLTGSAVVRAITATPTSLTIISPKPLSATKTFKVKGTNLNSSVTLKVTGAGFNIDKTTLTAAQANAGAAVTVKFRPTSLGTYTGKVTVSGGGALSAATVSLTGICNMSADVQSPEITPSWLIEGLLSNDPAILENPDADINGDGKIDIDDVRALISRQSEEDI